MSTNLRAVAEHAGVSLSTASKVLNGRPDVSRETQQRVMGAAQSLGYRAKPRPRSQQATLLMLFGELESPYNLAVLSGATAAAARAGIPLAVERMVPDADPAVLSRSWFDAAAARGVGGVVAVTTPLRDQHVAACSAAGIALLRVDPIGALSTPVVSISATNWAGGRAATEHLIELGHRRIGFVAGPAASQPATERLEGYRSALREHDLPFDAGLVAGDEFVVEPSRVAAHRLLDLSDPPTAIFAASDAGALGVLRAAAERDLRVPQDLSVVGFDDTMMARWLPEPLTTVRQPLTQMGQVAVERAAALMADPDAFAHPFQLETELVLRTTTAPPG